MPHIRLGHVTYKDKAWCLWKRHLVLAVDHTCPPPPFSVPHPLALCPFRFLYLSSFRSLFQSPSPSLFSSPFLSLSLPTYLSLSLPSFLSRSLALFLPLALYLASFPSRSHVSGGTRPRRGNVTGLNLLTYVTALNKNNLHTCVTALNVLSTDDELARICHRPCSNWRGTRRKRRRKRRDGGWRRARRKQWDQKGGGGGRGGEIKGISAWCD